MLCWKSQKYVVNPLNRPVLSIFRMFRYIFSLLAMTTENQIRREEEKDQVIELDHEEINALDFLYSEKTKKYIDMAYETTLNYFE